MNSSQRKRFKKFRVKSLGMFVSWMECILKSLESGKDQKDNIEDLKASIDAIKKGKL